MKESNEFEEILPSGSSRLTRMINIKNSRVMFRTPSLERSIIKKIRPFFLQVTDLLQDLEHRNNYLERSSDNSRPTNVFVILEEQEKIIKERDFLKRENTRLSKRIAYLEKVIDAEKQIDLFEVIEDV